MNTGLPVWMIKSCQYLCTLDMFLDTIFLATLFQTRRYLCVGNVFHRFYSLLSTMHLKKIFFLLTKRMLDSYLQIIVMKTWKKLPLLWSTSVCSLTNTNIFCNSVRGGERLKNYFKNKIIFSLFVIIQNCGNKQNNLTFQNINVLAFGIRVA